MTNTKKRVVIIWGWFGWIRTFYNLAWNKKFEITLIDARSTHSVKPVMPEVAYEDKVIEKTRFELRPVIEKKGHTFINEAVTKVDAKNNTLTIASWDEISYDYLVVATGAFKDFEAIKGLEEHGYSVCDETHAVKLAKKVKNFKWGKIVIGSAKSTWGTRVDAPKWWAPCEGPIGESMFMIDHLLRKKGLRDKSDIQVFTPGEPFFEDIDHTVRNAVWGLMGMKNIGLHLNKVPVEVTASSVKFEDGTELESDLTIMIPVYKGPQFLIDSKLGDEKGFIPTDKGMRHLDYPNIFAAGDVNANTMPKLGHLAAMQGDIVAAQIRKDAGEDVKVPEYKPEILCIMNMGWKEAWVLLTDIQLGGKYDVVWHGKWQGWFKRIFDEKLIIDNGKLFPEWMIHMFKKVLIMMWAGNKGNMPKETANSAK